MRIVSITLRIAFFFIILKESVKKSRILAARSFHSMPFMGLLLQVRDFLGISSIWRIHTIHILCNRK